MARSKKIIPITREDAKDALIDKIGDWDISSLMDYVQESEAKRIDSLSNTDLAWEYDYHCNMDDENVKTIILKQTKASKVLYE